MLLGILAVIDARTNVPAAAVTVDLEFSQDMQAFVIANEEQGSFFQKDTNAPKTNPGIVIIYENTKGSTDSPSPPSESSSPSMNAASSDDAGSATLAPVRPRSPVSATGTLLSRMNRIRERRKHALSERRAQTSSRIQHRRSTEQRAKKVVTMRLVRDDGIVIFPLYHFGSGSSRMVMDERRFRPGFYTLEAESTNVLTGERESVAQDFAWGVLALNTDKDRYHPDESADIHIGALDAQGEIICNANLTLTIRAPDGNVTTLRTRDRTIETTGTCGVKQGGLLSPDYETSYRFAREGIYVFKLESVTKDHTATIDAAVTVDTGHPLVIHRKAATRLWPFAPSSMDITVAFRKAFSGRITEMVPKGFEIHKTEPEAFMGSDTASGDPTLTWQGTWNAGTSVHLSYTYDAPDISPEFYLLGPLLLAPWTETGSIVALQEMRTWQIANDSASTSTNYDIVKDAVVAGGGELAFSSNYRLSDTIGEPGAGMIASTNYILEGGYRSQDENSATLNCWTTLDLGSIPGIGQATGEANCTVITDAPAGYTLSWQVTTGSGGTATGYMINQFEDVIAPFSPAVTGTPETWSVAASTAEWGGRLRSSSTDTDTKWGTDSASEKWLNVGSGSSVLVVSRNTRTATSGSTEQFRLRAEVGSTRVQPTGTYEVNVDFFLAAP